MSKSRSPNTIIASKIKNEKNKTPHFVKVLAWTVLALPTMLFLQREGMFGSKLHNNKEKKVLLQDVKPADVVHRNTNNKKVIHTSADEDQSRNVIQR